MLWIICLFNINKIKEKSECQENLKNTSNLKTLDDKVCLELFWKKSTREMRRLIVYVREWLDDLVMVTWGTMFSFHVSCIITFYCFLFSLSLQNKCGEKISRYSTEKRCHQLKDFFLTSESGWLSRRIDATSWCMFIQYCGELSSFSFTNIRKIEEKKRSGVELIEIKTLFWAVNFSKFVIRTFSKCISHCFWYFLFDNSTRTIFWTFQK